MACVNHGIVFMQMGDVHTGAEPALKFQGHNSIAQNFKELKKNVLNYWVKLLKY